MFKPEPYSSTTVKTVHEELAKAMTAILKPSTDFLTSNKLLKVAYVHHCSASERQRAVTTGRKSQPSNRKIRMLLFDAFKFKEIILHAQRILVIDT